MDYHTQHGDITEVRHALICVRTGGEFEGKVKDNIPALQGRIVTVYDGGLMADEDTSFYAGERRWEVTQEDYNGFYANKLPIPTWFAEGDLKFINTDVDRSTLQDRSLSSLSDGVPIGEAAVITTSSNKERTYRNMMSPEDWQQQYGAYGPTAPLYPDVENRVWNPSLGFDWTHKYSSDGILMGVDKASSSDVAYSVEVGNEIYGRSTKPVIVSKRRFRRLRGRKDIGHVTVSWPNVIIRRGTLTNFSMLVHPVLSRRGYR